MKTCSKCGVPKEHSEFYIHATGTLHAICKNCTLKQHRRRREKMTPQQRRADYLRRCEWAKKHPEETRAAKRRWQRANPENQRIRSRRAGRRKNGFTDEIIKMFLVAQRRLCPGCDAAVDEKSAADHCHRTNTARGILCVGCNTLLGRIEKSPDRVSRLVRYASKHLNAQAEALET